MANSSVEYRKAVKLLRRKGCEIMAGSKHHKVRLPNGEYIIMSESHGYISNLAKNAIEKAFGAEFHAIERGIKRTRLIRVKYITENL